jgi:hypothetical protein
VGSIKQGPSDQLDRGKDRKMAGRGSQVQKNPRRRLIAAEIS